MALAAFALLNAAPANAAMSLTAPTLFPTDSRPLSITGGKLNGDSRNDLAIAHRDGRSVGVLYADTSGSFEEAKLFDMPSNRQAADVAIGKVDGDKFNDLVVATGWNDETTPNLIVIYRGGKNGLKMKPKIVKIPTTENDERLSSVAVGDLDNDGRNDLVATGGDNRMWVVYSTRKKVKAGKAGKMKFAKPKRVKLVASAPFGDDLDPTDVTIVDLNRDGMRDIAVPVARDGGVYVFYANCLKKKGKCVKTCANPAKQKASSKCKKRFRATLAKRNSFKKRKSPTANYPSGLAVADFNQDGRLDLAIPHNYGSSLDIVSVLYGRSNGFKPAQTFNGGDDPGAISAGNLDGDQYPDIAVTNFGDSHLNVLRSNGDGFHPKQIVPLVNDPIAVWIGQLGRGPLHDIAVNRWNQAGITIYFNDAV